MSCFADCEPGYAFGGSRPEVQCKAIEDMDCEDYTTLLACLDASNTSCHDLYDCKEWPVAPITEGSATYFGPYSMNVGPAQTADLYAESMATVVATWSLARHIRGLDMNWCIDNEGAAAAAIRGASTQGDVDHFVQVAHLLWMMLECRVWIEWIDSKSNPADGLSRLGLLDPWTQNQGWELSEAAQPPWRTALGDPDELLKIAATLGF